MSAKAPGNEGISFRDAAIAELQSRAEKLPRGSVVTVVLSGTRPETLSGSAIHEAFVMLINMTVILTFVPLLYLFAALPVLRRRAAGAREVSGSRIIDRSGWRKRSSAGWRGVPFGGAFRQRLIRLGSP